jgi:hypothetical protein
MNEKEIYLLLNAIKKNTDIKRLVREGLSYTSIAKLTREAISNEYVQYENEKISLSEKGVQYYEQIKENYKRKNKDEWIEKDLKSQVKRIDKNFIFLPRQNELTFQVIS